MSILNRGNLKGVWYTEDGFTYYCDIDANGNEVPRQLPFVGIESKKFLEAFDIPFFEKRGRLFIYDPAKYQVERIQSEVFARGSNGEWVLLNPKYTGETCTVESIDAALKPFAEYLLHKDEIKKCLYCEKKLAGKSGIVVYDPKFNVCKDEIIDLAGSRYGIYRVRCSENYGTTSKIAAASKDFIIIDQNKAKDGRIDVLVPSFIKNIGRLIGTCGWQTQLFKELMGGIEPNFVRPDKYVGC